MDNLKGKMLRLKEDLTLVSVEDKAALLDVEKRCYHDLNDTAFFLLKLMEKGCPYENMKIGLISEFDATEEAVQRDIDNFIEELLRLGLVGIREEAIAREVIGEPGKGKKAYQAPQFEYEAEIAAVSGTIINNQSFS